MRLQYLLLAGIIALGWFSGGCGGGNQAIVEGPPTLAEVEGTPITRSDFLRGLEEGVGLDEGFFAGRQTLDMLIGRQVINAELKAQNITISEVESKALLDVIKKSLEESGSSYEIFLTQKGISNDQFMEQMERNLALQKLMISDAEVERYLKAHAEEYATPATVKYYSMAFMTKEAAEAASKEAREGKKDFATIAKEQGAIKTAAPPTQLLTATTGPAPFKMEGITAPDPNFLKQLFEAPAGQVSKPLSIKLGVPLETTRTTAEGKTETKKLGSAQREFWIVAKVVSHEGGTDAATEENKAKVRDKLFQKKADAGEVPRFINGLKVKAKIAIMDAKYKTLLEDYQRFAKEPPAQSPVDVPGLGKTALAPAPK